MRTKILAPLFACLLGWGAAMAPVSADAQSAPAMTCTQTQPGGTAQCGTLTVSSGSIYPERVIGVSVANPSFAISANGCAAGVELINNPCSLSISYNAGATDAGTISALVTVFYQVCPIDGDNHESCGGSSSRTIPISVFVTPAPAPPTSPVIPPVVVPAAPVTSSGTDVSFLPNCLVNVSAQKFCVVVPLLF